MRSIMPSSFRTTHTGSPFFGIVRPSDAGSTTTGSAKSFVPLTTSSTTTTSPVTLRRHRDRRTRETPDSLQRKLGLQVLVQLLVVVAKVFSAPSLQGYVLVGLS